MVILLGRHFSVKALYKSFKRKGHRIKMNPICLILCLFLFRINFWKVRSFTASLFNAILYLINICDLFVIFRMKV